MRATEQKDKFHCNVICNQVHDAAIRVKNENRGQSVILSGVMAIFYSMALSFDLHQDSCHFALRLNAHETVETCTIQCEEIVKNHNQ